MTRTPQSIRRGGAEATSRTVRGLVAQETRATRAEAESYLLRQALTAKGAGMAQDEDKDRAWFEGIYPVSFAQREAAARNAVLDDLVTNQGTGSHVAPGGLHPWGPRHDPRVERAVGGPDFAQVLGEVEREYAEQASRRVRGSGVMWELPGGQVLRDSGDAPMGMPASAAGRQVSRAHRKVPVLGCQECREAGQVLVPCEHDAPDQDCPRCAGTGKTCGTCRGSGTITITEATVRGEQVQTQIDCSHPDGEDGADCTLCHGSGQVCSACGGSDQRPVPCAACQGRPCTACGATGRTGEAACPACGGSGTVTVPRAAPPQPPAQPEPEAVPEFVRARYRTQATPAASIWR